MGFDLKFSFFGIDSLKFSDLQLGCEESVFGVVGVVDLLKFSDLKLGFEEFVCGVVGILYFDFLSLKLKDFLDVFNVLVL